MARPAPPSPGSSGNGFLASLEGGYPFVGYLRRVCAEKLTQKIGPMGIDATTRIVGFFVSARGVGLIFDGVIQALEMR